MTTIRGVYAPGELVPSSIGSALPTDWRRSKTSRTAMEPSPMAAAARLTEPLRTSPTAKIPALLVSRNSGVVVWPPGPDTGMPVPVSRKPWLSSASWPASQPVLGSAPMKTNSPRMASSD